jgi:DNA-binding MarR family transcriptional regulator
MIKQEWQEEAVLSKKEYETLAASRQTLRQFLNFSKKVAGDLGLTPQKYELLLAIKGFPDREYATIGELAERLAVRHHTAVELVDRLSAQGMVVRQPSETDRRQVHVLLTEMGSQVLGKLAVAHRDQWKRLAPSLLRDLKKLISES